jgi:hypothetical protein
MKNSMDSNTSGIVAIIGLVLSVGGTALAVVNHTRIRSNCCGKKLELSVDVSKTAESPGVEQRQKALLPSSPSSEPAAALPGLSEP